MLKLRSPGFRGSGGHSRLFPVAAFALATSAELEGLRSSACFCLHSLPWCGSARPAEGLGVWSDCSVPAVCVLMQLAFLSARTSPVAFLPTPSWAHSPILVHWLLCSTILSTITPLGLGPRRSQDWKRAPCEVS